MAAAMPKPTSMARSGRTRACLDDGSRSRLYRKGPGKEAKLCFIGHGLMENRHGLLVDACLSRLTAMPSG